MVGIGFLQNLLLPSPVIPFRKKMKEVQKIAQKVLVLLMDILVFTWRVVREIILPTRRRKGNVMSSLLTFFVGLLERVVSFEKSILQRPVIFSHKYVKQILIVTVGFLFLLSSFEWTVGPSADGWGNRTQEVVVCAPAAGSIGTVASRRVDRAVIASTRAVVTKRFFVPALFPALNVGPAMSRRWLHFGVFRI